jgi:hypothetical protein
MVIHLSSFPICLVREPLAHFALVGAVLFAISTAQSPETPPRDEIVISEGEIENLATVFSRTWQREPSREEIQGLIDVRVREEVLYREALALGLDAGDVIVRRRMVQKLEFLSDDLAARRDPSEVELQAWLDANAEQYARPARVSFRQVFLDPARRGEALAADAETLLAELAGGADPAARGDSTLLPASLDDEPLRSAYGVHLVRVKAFVPGGPAALDDVRMAVTRDWRAAERRKAQEALYDKLRTKYYITIASGDEAVSEEANAMDAGQ